MQTVCTSLQTDNHTNTSSLNFYRPDALPDAQPTVSKHRRAQPQKVECDKTEHESIKPHRNRHRAMIPFDSENKTRMRVIAASRYRKSPTCCRCHSGATRRYILPADYANEDDDIVCLSHASRCQRRFRALPVIGTARRWLHMTGEERLPVNVHV